MRRFLAWVTPTADWLCLALVHFHCLFILLLFLAFARKRWKSRNFRRKFYKEPCLIRSHRKNLLHHRLQTALNRLRCSATSSFFTSLQSLKLCLHLRICHPVFVDYVRQQSEALFLPLNFFSDFPLQISPFVVEVLYFVRPLFAATACLLQRHLVHSSILNRICTSTPSCHRL